MIILFHYSILVKLQKNRKENGKTIEKNVQIQIEYNEWKESKDNILCTVIS